MKEEKPLLDDLLAALESDGEERAEVWTSLQEPKSFTPGFAERTTAVVFGREVNGRVEEMLPRMFRWVAAAGVAAVAVLVGWTWLEQDAVTLEAMAGLADLSLSDEAVWGSI